MHKIFCLKYGFHCENELFAIEKKHPVTVKILYAAYLFAFLMYFAQTEKFTVDWDSEVKGMVLSSYFYGFMISTMIGGYLTEKVGYKIVIGIAMGTGAISTLITPFGIITNPYLVITLRTIVGLFQVKKN